MYLLIQLQICTTFPSPVAIEFKLCTESFGLNAHAKTSDTGLVGTKKTRGASYSFEREVSAERFSATPQQGAVRIPQALACLLQA